MVAACKSVWLCYAILTLIFTTVYTEIISAKNNGTVDEDKSKSLYQFLDEPDAEVDTDRADVRRAPYQSSPPGAAPTNGAMNYWPGFGPHSPPAINSVPTDQILRSSSVSHSPYPTQYSPQSHAPYYPPQAYRPPVPSPYPQQQQHAPNPQQSQMAGGRYPGAGQYAPPPRNPAGGPGLPSVPGFSPDANLVPRYPWETNQAGPPPTHGVNPYGGAQGGPPPQRPFPQQQGGYDGFPRGQAAPQGNPRGAMGGPAQGMGGAPPGFGMGGPQQQRGGFGGPGMGAQQGGGFGGPAPGMGAPQQQGGFRGPAPGMGAPQQQGRFGGPAPGMGAPQQQGGFGGRAPGIGGPQGGGFGGPAPGFGGAPRPPMAGGPSIGAPSPYSAVSPDSFPRGGAFTGQPSMYGNVNPMSMVGGGPASGPMNRGGPGPRPQMGPRVFGPLMRFSLAANKATYLTAPMMSPKGPPGPIRTGPLKDTMRPPRPAPKNSPLDGGPVYPIDDFMAASPPIPQPQPHPQALTEFPRPGAMAWPQSTFGAVAGPGPQQGPFGLASRSPAGALEASYETMGGGAVHRPVPVPSLPIDIGGGGIDFGNAIGPAYPATLSMQPPISNLDMNAAGMYGALVLDMDTVVDDDVPQGYTKYTPGASVPIGGSTYDYQTISDEEQQGPAATVMDALLQQVQRLRAVSYSRSDCQQCQAAEALLESAYNVPVTVFHMDKLAKGSEFLQFLGSITGSEEVPQVFICGYYIGGYEHVIKYHSSSKLADFVNKCFDNSPQVQNDDPTEISVSADEKDK